MEEAWLDSFSMGCSIEQDDVDFRECSDCGKFGIPTEQGYECPECRRLLGPEQQDVMEKPIENKRTAPSIQVTGETAKIFQRKVDSLSAPAYKDTQANDLFRSLINYDNIYMNDESGRQSIPREVLKEAVRKYQEVSQNVVIRSRNKKSTLTILICNTCREMGYLRYPKEVARMLQMPNARISKGKSILHTLFSGDKISEDMNQQRWDMYIDAVFRAVGLKPPTEILPGRENKIIDPIYIQKIRQFSLAMLEVMQKHYLGVSHRVLTVVAGTICNVLIRVPKHPNLDWPSSYPEMARYIAKDISIQGTTIDTIGKKFKSGQYHSRFLPIYRRFQALEMPL